MNKIIINADDCGISESIDKGIFYCLDKNLISDFSLMANGENFENTLRNIKSRNIKNVGCHICLVDQEKMLADDSKEILGTNNRFYKSSTPYKFFFNSFFGKEIKQQCELEINKQISKILDHNLKISHLDSHQHTHLFPMLSSIFINACEKYKIKFLRQPISFKRNFRGLPFTFFSNIFKSRVKKKQIFKLNTYGFDWNNGVEYDSLVKLVEKNDHFNNITFEILCHPGEVNDHTLNKYDHWNFKNWEKEIEVLKKVKEFLIKKNIKIISFNELSTLQK
tara:strand:- start:493 stop:1329 length:837 start_codon:yes stop_codon:yes gene_type:complete